MESTGINDHVRDFVEEALQTGIMLSELICNLIEGLPEDAYPGESHAEVVLEMLTGTIRPVADAAGEELVRSATALLAGSRARTLSDLRRLMELVARRESAAARRRRDMRSG